MNPLVSFIIPFYNAEKFIAETIDSVLLCGYEQSEIIIVDDGSTDNSLKICCSYEKKTPKIKIIQHNDKTNKGASTSRKTGIQEAKGEFIYFLDADDILLPGVIDKYVAVFSENPDVVLIHGEIIDLRATDDLPKMEHNFVIGFSNRKYLLSDESYYLKSNRICNSTVCVRKSALIDIDFNYDQIFPLGEDWVLWNLLALKGSFYYFARPMIKYRIHKNSATSLALQKKQVYLQYNLMENYLCMLAKTRDAALRGNIKDKLFDLINDLYKVYQKKPITESDQQGIYEQVVPRDQLIISLKKKIYNLERGYGYYFYFLYIVKRVFSKLFYFK